MTQKEMKEIIENVDPEHGWRLDHTDGYSSRRFWFRNFDQATVIAEEEEHWIPALLDQPGRRTKGVTHYYFFRDGDDTAERPLASFRETKTSVLNLLKEAERKRA